MKERYLAGYKDFKCIAADCPATCCSGWQIMIDKRSLETYRSFNDEALTNSVNWEESCFKQKPNGDCAFLQENGLCALIIKKGEQALCRTCDLYPRHIEVFPGAFEYSLSASCPVVAEKLMALSSLLSYTEENSTLEIHEEFDTFNEEIYQELLACREEFFSLIKDPAISFDEKCGRILRKMQDVQDRYDGWDVEELSDGILNLNIMEHMELLTELEQLDPSFCAWLQQARSILHKAADEDTAQFEKAHPLWQIQCENILYYFLYTYLCVACYDEYIFGMAAVAVYSAKLMKALWIAKYLELGRPLSISEQAKILYLYSRELEHSTENLFLLEQLLDSLELTVDEQ